MIHMTGYDNIHLFEHLHVPIPAQGLQTAAVFLVLSPAGPFGYIGKLSRL
jgi:hypothetical protein